MEKDTHKDDRASVEQHQQDQSVQDTEMPPPSPPHVTPTPADTMVVQDVPPHVTPTPADTMVVQDVPDTSGKNVNLFTIEDLKKMLHQTSLQAQLCTNPILVSVEEL